MNVTLSAEVWAAIALIVAPITAEIIATLRQGSVVRLLTEEMKLLRQEMSQVKDAVAKLPSHEGRIFKLESLTARRQRK